MSRQVHLAIDVSDQRASVLKAVAARSRTVRLDDDHVHFNALITDQPQAALNAVADQKHVMVLDPFSISDKDRGKLESTGLAVPALGSRFQPSIAQVKQALDGGKLGKPGLLRIHCWQPSSIAASDLLERELDLAVWLCGGRPTEVYSCARPGYLQAHLGFDGSSMALIDIDTTVPDGNTYYSLSLIGSTGAAYADDHRNMNLLFAAGGPSALPTSQRDVAIAEMIDTFASEILAGQGFTAGWQQINTVIEATDQVRASANAGHVITGGNHG